MKQIGSCKIVSEETFVKRMLHRNISKFFPTLADTAQSCHMKWIYIDVNYVPNICVSHWFPHIFEAPGPHKFFLPIFFPSLININVKNQSSFQFYQDANPPGAKGQAEGFSKEDHLQKGFWNINICPKVINSTNSASSLCKIFKRRSYANATKLQFCR